MTPRLSQIPSIAAIALAVFPGQSRRVSPVNRVPRKSMISPIARSDS
jgi:hypothetical protein